MPNDIDIAEVFQNFRIWYNEVSKVDTLKNIGRWSFYMGVWFTLYLSSGVSIDPSDLEFSALGTMISSFHNTLVSHIWQIIGYGLLIWSFYMVIKTVWRIREHGIIGYAISAASFSILPTLFFYGTNQLVVWVAIGFIVIFSLSQKYG